MQELVKIVVTVPQDEADSLRQAIGGAGAGQVGEYSYCSYSIVGTGRFLPGDKANPTIGSRGKLEQVTEERVEVTCSKELVGSVVKAIKDNHSYEEPAIDVYPLLNIST